MITSTSNCNYLGINNKFEAHQSSFDLEYQNLKSEMQQACASKYILQATTKEALVTNNQGKFDFSNAEPTQPDQPPPAASAENTDSAAQQSPALGSGTPTNSFVQFAGPENNAQSAVSGGSCQLPISPSSISLGQILYWGILLLPGIWSALRKLRN